MRNIPIEFFCQHTGLVRSRKSRKPEVSKNVDKGGGSQNAKLVKGGVGDGGRHTGFISCERYYRSITFFLH